MKCIYSILIFIWAYSAVSAQISVRLDDTINPGKSTYMISGVKDGLGNIYTTGYYNNGSNKDIILIKYNTSGDEEWRKVYDGGSDDSPVKIGVDSRNRVYILGSTVTSYSRYLVLKYDANGTKLWDKKVGGITGSFAVTGAVTSNGHSIITGSVPVAAGDTNIFTVKYDSTGTLVFSETYDAGASTADKERPIDLTVNSKGDVLITGYTYDNATTKEALVLRYNASGTFKWAKKLSHAAFRISGVSITSDISGNVYALIQTLEGDRYPRVFKCDSNGIKKFDSTYFTTIGKYTKKIQFYLSALYLSGYQNNFDELFFTKLTTTGAITWTKTLTNEASMNSNANFYFDATAGGFAIASKRNAYYARITKIATTGSIKVSEEFYATTLSLISDCFGGNNGETVLTGSNGNLFLCNAPDVSFDKDSFFVCVRDTGKLIASGASIYDFIFYDYYDILDTSYYDFKSYSDRCEVFAKKDLGMYNHYIDIIVTGYDEHGCPAKDTVDYLTSDYGVPSISGPTEVCIGGDSVRLYSSFSDFYRDGVYLFSDFEFYTKIPGDYYAVKKYSYPQFNTICEYEGKHHILTGYDYEPANLGNDTSLPSYCDESRLYLDPTCSGCTYSWSTGSTNNYINLQSDFGAFSVTVNNDKCNRTSTDTIIVSVEFQHALGNDTTITVNDSITLNAGPNYVYYLWNNGSTSSSITLKGSTLGIGTHTVIAQVVKAGNPCEAYDTILITVTTAVGINSESTKEWEIYPSVSSGDFTINMPLSGNYSKQIQIFSMDGVLVYENSFYNDEMPISLKISKGLYLVKMNVNNQLSTKKIVIN